MPINAVMLSEEIVFANTAKVDNCHCEEFDDPFDELRAGCGNPRKRGRGISILGKGSAGRLGMSS